MSNQLDGPTAGQIMRRDVHTVRGDVSLEELVRRLLDLGTSNLPVVDGDGVGHPLLGFVSERDCLATLATEVFHGSPRPPYAVETIMRRHPVCVSPDVDLFALSSLFTNHGYRHLPVTEGGRLLGLVSRRDVLREMDTFYRDATRESLAERYRSPSLIATHSFPSAEDRGPGADPQGVEP